MSSIIGETDGITPLDPDEKEGLKHKHVNTQGELNELEQVNIQSGLLWLSRARNIEVLSEMFIRRLHKKMFGEVWTWAGTFRSTEKNIGIDPSQIGMQLRILLDDAYWWVEHETYRPLEAAVRFHHRLVSIHCFPNGNGRHARFAADAYLKDSFKHPPIDWASGFDLVKSNVRRDEYIAALRNADRGYYDPLMVFVGID